MNLLSNETILYMKKCVEDWAFSGYEGDYRPQHRFELKLHDQLLFLRKTADCIEVRHVATGLYTHFNNSEFIELLSIAPINTNKIWNQVNE